MFLRSIIQAYTRRFYSSQNYQHSMEVFPILALEDNYMYVLQDTANSVCAVVDPVEPQKVIN